MGYLHIENLYRPDAQAVLLFKRVYALEKVHGTSAHIAYREGRIHFFSGGEKHANFVALFDEEDLRGRFEALGHESVTIFGEAYGGKCQGMSHTYGKDLRFIAFDVKIGNCWLAVPSAARLVDTFGLEFVPWVETAATLEELDALRDKPSEVAIRRGCGDDKIREGIIIRPPIEVTTNDGGRVIAKHKGAAFSERIHTPKVKPGTTLEVMTRANEIAEEWVTPRRLEHVLDKLPQGIGVENTKMVIDAMVEDVTREASGEILDSRETRVAIGRKAALLFKKHLADQLAKSVA